MWKDNFNLEREINNIKYYSRFFHGVTVVVKRHPMFPFPVPTPIETEIGMVIAEHELENKTVYSVALFTDGKVDSYGPFSESDLENKIKSFDKKLNL